jgi:hypothetical protein
MSALFQKKDHNVKQIPPFKPLSSDETTPEGTPEKKDTSKEKKVWPMMAMNDIIELMIKN